MAKAARAESLTLQGPAGELEALLEVPDGPNAGIAVVCHPHPLHGGAMTNKVTHTVARSMNLAGIVSLRFNFRGVGTSEGTHDDGKGERDDVIAAAEWLRRRYPDLPLFLAGFSFGSAMAVLASHELDCAGLVLIAPPVGRILSPSSQLRDGLRTYIVQGAKDDVVDADAVVEWVNRQPPGARISMLEEAGHFFHGDLIALRGLLTEQLGHWIC